MKIEINGQEYDIIITKKRGLKRINIRVKEDLNIYISVNTLTSNREIIKIIEDNKNSIAKMVTKMANRVDNKKEIDNNFYYLGKKYEISELNVKKVVLGNNKVFINKNVNIDNWYKKQAKVIFQQELDKIYHSFHYDIPYPTLMIRSMKTRWGVCNYKLEKVTLNLELIKRNIKYLDYVIIHELSHFLYHNHSKDFWNCVEEHCPNYNKLRKDLNNNE